MFVDTALAPQSKPIPFLIRFCSFRLFPAHCTVTGHVCSGSFTSSFIVILIGLEKKISSSTHPPKPP